MPNQHKSDTLFLDGIRGFAAFYVMVGHSRWLLWEGYTLGYSQHPDQYNWLETTIVHVLSSFRYGHEAVLLFFVLSGFVIHLRYAQYLKSDNQHQFDFVPFFLRRLKRIMPPLLLALLLTFIIDQIGLYLKLPIYSSATPYSSINQNITPNHNWLILGGNLLFLMKFYVPVFGTNGPLWSLAYEWWFYMLYPLMYIFLKRSFTISTLIVFSLYLLVSVIPIKNVLLAEIFSLYPCWWLGTLLAEIYSGRSKIKFSTIMPFSLLLFITTLGNLNFSLRGFNDFLWATGFCGIFSFLFWLQANGIKLKLLQIMEPLGKISYSLYVIHMPIIVFLSGLLMHFSDNHSLPQDQWFILLGVIVSIIFAIGAYQLAEKPFTRKQKQKEHNLRENYKIN